MKTIAAIAAFLGLLSVMLGAAGDHMILAGADERTRHIFDTALRYHQLYAILVFLMALYATKLGASKVYTASVYALLAGTILFCGSLYASVMLAVPSLTSLTPVGGFALMAGWVLAAVAMLRKENR